MLSQPVVLLLSVFFPIRSFGLHSFSGWSVAERGVTELSKAVFVQRSNETLLPDDDPRSREELAAEVSRLQRALARLRIQAATEEEPPFDEEPSTGSTQHHALDRSTTSVSIMLIGAIAFQMGLFYLVNWPDEDIQYYTYHVIGRSISIFTAVLIFDAIHGIVYQFFGVDHSGSRLSIVAGVGQMLSWFVVMQVVTAHVAGALPWNTELADPDELEPGEELEEVKQKWKRREMGLKCWAGMLTHITAFACIATWSLVQQGPFFRQTFWTCLLVVPMAFVFISILYEGATWVRFWISMADDGAISKSEGMWDEESEEAENDVMAMALSYITVQAFQFWFLGVMPDEKGTLPPGALRPGVWGRDCLFLCVLALASAITTFVAFRRAAKLVFASDSHEFLRTRLATIFVNYTSMCFAWCLYFATKAGLHFFAPKMHIETLVAKIVIALAVSLVSFVIIFFLDFLADQHLDGSDEQRAIAKVILAKGLLIGWSWEGCFATAFHSISHNLGPMVMTSNLGLSFLLCLIVIPAYRHYILPEIEQRLEVLEMANKGAVPDRRRFTKLHQLSTEWCLWRKLSTAVTHVRSVSSTTLGAMTRSGS